MLSWLFNLVTGKKPEINISDNDSIIVATDAKTLAAFGLGFDVLTEAQYNLIISKTSEDKPVTISIPTSMVDKQKGDMNGKE